MAHPTFPWRCVAIMSTFWINVWVQDGQPLGLSVHPISVQFIKFWGREGCIKDKVYSSKVRSLRELKGKIPETTSSYPKHSGRHMTTTVELEVGCMPSYKRSSHRNSTPKIMIKIQCYLYFTICFIILVLSHSITKKINSWNHLGLCKEQ
jgi:hypothetical protein